MDLSTIFLKLLNMSFTGGCAIILICIVRLLFRKLPKKYLCILWAVVLIRLLTPFTIPTLYAGQPDLQEPIPETIMLEANPTIESGIEMIDNAVNPVLAKHFSPDSEPFEDFANPLQIVLKTGSYVWSFGIAVMLLYTGWILWGFYRQVREAVPECKLGENEKIYRCSVSTPVVTGILKPRIYLPFDLKEPEISHVLLHERMHIQRKDHWIKLLFYIAVVVHWFNPLVWLAYRLLERDMEMACDEAVLQKLGTDAKGEYCQSLLNLAAPKNHFVGNPVAFGESDVKMRIKNLLNYKKPYLWITILAVLVIVAVAVTCLSSPTEGEGEEAQPVENEVQEDAELPDGLKATFEPTEPFDLSEIYESYESENGFSLTYPNILAPVIINDQEGFVLSASDLPDSSVPDIFAVITADDTVAETYQKEAVEKYEKETCYGGTVFSDTGTTISYQGRLREDRMLEIYYLVMEEENMLLVKVQMPEEARESYEHFFAGMVQTIKFIN